MVYHLDASTSSLLDEVYYDDANEELTVVFKKYYVSHLEYVEVPFKVFDNFSQAKSFGKFYLSIVKPNFKIKQDTMADKPKGVNRASKEKRFIQCRIDVTKIKKEWLFVGEKGVYLDFTLSMLPDGEVDKFENLGMITQAVPKDVYKSEVKLPADKRSRGEILGNATEFERKGAEGAPGSGQGTLMAETKDSDGISDDLPF